MTIEIPGFKYSRIAGKRTAVLQADIVFNTPLRGIAYEDSHQQLFERGMLKLRSGFIWDLASGPDIDTSGMIYASIAHDALYEAMNTGLLDWDHRKTVDRFFVDLLEMAGVPWWRRAYSWLAVRYGYPIAKWTGIGL